MVNKNKNQNKEVLTHDELLESKNVVKSDNEINSGAESDPEARQSGESDSESVHLTSPCLI